ncbi:MAG TPA: GAF domain-containing protein [Terriglobia bacterium]|nr:GAF domain-containing protein [Terriglobia bacterium]
MAQPVTRYSKLLLGANVVLTAALLAGVTGLWFLSGQGRRAVDPVSTLITQQAQSASGLLMSELERVRQETRAAAELATHIFSNPESYRLAAQPGEYDYDQTTGLYGSARNDGTSVVFLSAASVLNPDILREIRLSEYLNPVFKTSASLNARGRSIALYTTDGLVRSYPWFDFKSRIASGALKRSFSVTDLPFFAKAMPSRNPSKDGIWEVVKGGSQDEETQLVCAAPFLAGDSFRGVVAIEVDAEKLAAQLFRNLELTESLGLLLAGGDRVLGTSRKPESNVKLNGLLPAVLKDLKVSGLMGLEPLLRRLANGERFVGTQAGFHVAMVAAAGWPVRPVLVVPEALAARRSNSVQGSSFPVWLSIGAVLACGLLLADAWWIAETRRNLAEAERKLSDSFTALSDLNLRSALIAAPQAVLGELYPKFNEGLLSIQNTLETSPAAPVPEQIAEVTESVGRDLKQIERQAAVFCAFDAADSADSNLNRLAAALRSLFEARLVSFLSYSESALRILPQGAGSAEEATMEWKEGRLFDALKRSQGVVSSSSLVLSSEEQQLLSPMIEGSYLAMPLLDDQKLVGAVVLSDKLSGVSAEDEALLGALQAALSKTVQNTHKCDDLSKLNQSRHKYCVELTKAVEAPLDRIRTEVQYIYARLGKLTPYYKQHCETILFEVGKLYEMLREARETETAAASKSAEQAPSSEAALPTVEKKDRE